MEHTVKQVITDEHVINHFRPEMEAKWRVKAGSLLEITAPDALGGTIRKEEDVLGEVDLDHANDSVGPIFVEGAEPGDALTFEVVDIEVTGGQGCTLIIPGFGLLQDRALQPQTKICRVERDRVIFDDRISLPLQPMIGTIGVAPSSGVYNTVTPHDHGGNMDSADIRPGNTVYFPVSVPGALLALGDGHAIMGDGEVCGTGVEAPIRVTAKVDVVKGLRLLRPIIETTNSWMLLASAGTLEEACKIATEDLIEQLKSEHRLDWEEAYMLASLVGHLRICQVVDPLRTVRMEISKEILPRVHTVAR